MLPVVAIVGRPNVGKSTLFNRLTGSRDALVASFPGLTRDRQYGTGAIGDFPYVVVDTGGMSGEGAGIDGPMTDQALRAIEEADLVLLLVDAEDGRVAADEAIAELLRRRGASCLLVVNKTDGRNRDDVASEFFALGMGDPLCISAINGSGVRQLVDDHMARELPQVPEAENETIIGIKVAVAGRPNVGKSTLVNRLLGEDRVLVFDEPGTTRDSIHIPFERDGQAYTIIDTAGVRRRARVRQKIEKFSVIKTLEAIEYANVVILMVDAREGIVDQDLHLLSHILKAGRALVIAVNKWDATSPEQRTLVRKDLERRLTFISFAETHFISALHGSQVDRLYRSVGQAHDSAVLKVSTSRLNDILAKALFEHQPPLVRGRRIRLRYAHPGGSNPPVVVIHGNQTQEVPQPYRRYLTHRFTEALGLKGTPLRLEFRDGDNPYRGRKNTLTERQLKRRRRMIRHTRKNRKKRQR